MADPLSVIGLTGNIVQFVRFCGTLLNKSQEIYRSADRALVDYLELEALTIHLDKLMVGMMMELGSDTERQLENLCQQCSSTAQGLLQAVKELNIGGKNKRWKSFRQALSTICSSDRIQSMSSRLEAFRRQIDMPLIVLLWCVFFPLIFDKNTCSPRN